MHSVLWGHPPSTIFGKNWLSFLLVPPGDMKIHSPQLVVPGIQIGSSLIPHHYLQTQLVTRETTRTTYVVVHAHNEVKLFI